MNFELHPKDSFSYRCTTCHLLAFHPKFCCNCNAPVPPSTMITVTRQDNTTFEATASEILKTFIDYLEEPIFGYSSFTSEPREKQSTGWGGRYFLIDGNETTERKDFNQVRQEMIKEARRLNPLPMADNKITKPKLQKDKEARNEATSQAQATKSRGFGNSSATELIDDSNDDFIMWD